MLNMTVVVLAEDVERRQLREEAKTQVVNAHGGLLKNAVGTPFGSGLLAEQSQNWYGRELPGGACRRCRAGVL